MVDLADEVFGQELVKQYVVHARYNAQRETVIVNREADRLASWRKCDAYCPERSPFLDMVLLMAFIAYVTSKRLDFKGFFLAINN